MSKGKFAPVWPSWFLRCFLGLTSNLQSRFDLKTLQFLTKHTPKFLFLYTGIHTTPMEAYRADRDVISHSLTSHSYFLFYRAKSSYTSDNPHKNLKHHKGISMHKGKPTHCCVRKAFALNPFSSCGQTRRQSNAAPGEHHWSVLFSPEGPPWDTHRISLDELCRRPGRRSENRCDFVIGGKRDSSSWKVKKYTCQCVYAYMGEYMYIYKYM